MKDNFDKIKNALGQEVPDWDGDLLWKEIETSLPEEQKKKRRFIIWFFSGSTLLLLLLFLAFHKMGLQKSNVSFENTQNEYSKIKNKLQETEDANKQINSAKTNTQTISSSSEQDLNKNQINIKKEENKEQTDLTYIDNNLRKQNFETKQLYTKPTTDHSEEGNDSQREYNLDANIDEEQNFERSLNSPNSSKNGNSELSHEYISTQDLTIQTYLPIETKSKLDWDSNLLEQNYQRILSRAQKRLVFIPESSKKKLPRNKYISVSLAALDTYRGHEGISQSEWLQNRIESDLIGFTHQVGVEYSQEVHSRFRLGIGLNLQQTREDFIRIDTLNTTTGTTISDTAIIINNIGIPGEVNFVEHNLRLYSWPNYYRSIHVPITLHFQVMKNKPNLQIGVGISSRIWTKYKGYTILEDGNITNEQAEIDKLYKKFIPISGLHLTASYQIDYKAWQFRLGLKRDIGIQSILTNPDVKMWHSTIGLQLEVAKRL